MKAGPVVGAAAGKVLQQDVHGAEQLRVQHAPSMQRENDPVREVRARVHYAIWLPRNRKGVLESTFFRDRSRRPNKAGSGLWRMTCRSSRSLYSKPAAAPGFLGQGRCQLCRHRPGWPAATPPGRHASGSRKLRNASMR